jgi:hypothetical protein
LRSLAPEVAVAEVAAVFNLAGPIFLEHAVDPKGEVREEGLQVIFVEVEIGEVISAAGLECREKGSEGFFRRGCEFVAEGRFNWIAVILGPILFEIFLVEVTHLDD